MGLKARMGFGDELTVEALFAPTRFVSADQQDSSSHRVETEGYSPYAACGIEAQLFHIRVTRTVQRIGTRPAEQWPELLQQLGVGQQFVLHLFREGVKFRLELLVKEDCPCHLYSMYLDTYAVKYIKRLERSATKKHPPQTARRVSELILNCLIYIDHAKDAVEIVLRTGGVVKGVRIPVSASFGLAEFLMAPTKAPVVGLNPLMMPLLVLLLISRVPLSTPKFDGATANPQG